MYTKQFPCACKKYLLRLSRNTVHTLQFTMSGNVVHIPKLMHIINSNIHWWGVVYNWDAQNKFKVNSKQSQLDYDSVFCSYLSIPWANIDKLHIYKKIGWNQSQEVNNAILRKSWGGVDCTEYCSAIHTGNWCKPTSNLQSKPTRKQKWD